MVNPWWLDWFMAYRWYIFGSLGAFFIMTYMLPWLFPKRTKPLDSYGSARFGNRDDAEKAGLLEGPGVVLGRLGADYLRISAKHVAFVGPSDSGKTSSAVCSLLGFPEDTFTLDLRGLRHPRSLTSLTMPYRAKTYGPAYLFAPADPYSPHRVNPYDFIRWETPFEAIDLQRMAIRQTTRSDVDLKQEGPSYYRHGAQGVHFLGLMCLRYVQHQWLCSPSGLRHFLMAARPPYRRVAEHLSRHPHPTLAEQATYLSLQPAKDFEKWWVDAINHLDTWADPVLAHNTDATTIPLQDLQVGPQPMSIYIHITPEDLDRLGSFFENLVKQLRTLAHESSHDVPRRRLLVTLDDMGELKRFSPVQHIASFDRDEGWRLLLLFQSMNQLWEVIGPHASLLDNIGALVAFQPNHPDTAEFFSRALDNMTVLDPVTRESSGRLGTTISQGEQAHARRLKTPGEVRQLGNRKVLLFIYGQPPFEVEQVRWYENEYWANCVASAATQGVDLGGLPARTGRAWPTRVVG